MFRAASRLIARPTAQRAVPRTFAAPSRRQLTTAPPSQQRRSWKSLFARLGIAGTLIYYYNTTDVFAEEPTQAVVQIPDTDTESEHLPTIDALSSARKERKAVEAQLALQESEAAAAQQGSGGEGGMGGLEEEADQQGAFNPETGEINWDCPCLGGMAHGPCGEQFKSAFSCFVYSKEEPKGMDCIEKFKDMQGCFREYPEIYGSELDDGEDEEDDLGAETKATPETSDTSVKGETKEQRGAPAAGLSEGALSGEKDAKVKPTLDSRSAPTPAASQTTSPESQPEPSSPPPSNTQERAAESGARREAPAGALSLVPDEYKPGTKSASS